MYYFLTACKKKEQNPVNPAPSNLIVNATVIADNTGKVDGDEVTELYMKSAKDVFQNTIRTLVGFERTF